MSQSKKLRIALLFGGKSAEHEVSVISARNIYDALDKERYDVTLVGITKTGDWKNLSQEEFAVLKEVFEEGKSYSDRTFQDIDVVFPVLHGPFGEDGAIQGLCKMANVSYVGPGILSSAVGMDKDVAKRLLREAGLPVARAVVVRKHQTKPAFSELQTTLSDVLFIKPANLGSSVGVSRVTTEDEYQKALTKAFLYDTKVLVEEAIRGREIECAVLGNEQPQASLVGEVITNPKKHSFYSYEAKYLDEGGSVTIIPSELLPEKVKEVQDLAIKVFQTLCCEGMSRVDFFLGEDGSWVVNEINTIPGFTSISMYPKMWEASGINYSDLIDKLITLALERHQRDSALTSEF